jgi:hypothetical protein
MGRLMISRVTASVTGNDCALQDESLRASWRYSGIG